MDINKDTPMFNIDGGEIWCISVSLILDLSLSLLWFI